jgi:hypothetical protein
MHQKEPAAVDGTVMGGLTSKIHALVDEVQTFRIDADILRFAVDHVSDLALAVIHSMH